MGATPQPLTTTIDAPLLRELAVAIGGIRFGTVEVTIHDGRVVQIERREKIRWTGRDDTQPMPART